MSDALIIFAVIAVLVIVLGVAAWWWWKTKATFTYNETTRTWSGGFYIDNVYGTGMQGGTINKGGIPVVSVPTDNTTTPITSWINTTKAVVKPGDSLRATSSSLSDAPDSTVPATFSVIEINSDGSLSFK